MNCDFTVPGTLQMLFLVQSGSVPPLTANPDNLFLQVIMLSFIQLSKFRLVFQIPKFFNVPVY